jgi:MEDS: MEthanogen/methylotroph, DcmR Sensory domain
MGAGQIRIAGDVPHPGNSGRFEGWDRYEAAVNTVWHDFPVWGRCLYDITTTPPAVLEVVERTHPRIVSSSGSARKQPLPGHPGVQRPPMFADRDPA